MSRDEYIEHLRARLKAAEEIIHKATQQDSVGWQFLANGEWHQGSLFNNHRRNTEEEGYPVRDVYAGPVFNTVEVAQSPRKKVTKMNNQVLIDRELLEQLLVGHLGIDYKAAKHKILALLATPAPIPDAGEAVEVVAWMNDEDDEDKEYDSIPLMTVAQHNRIVSTLQSDHSEDVRTMVVPDIARFEKHAMKAKDCLSECDVVLLSSIRRLLAASTTPGDSQ